jgi:hypothetical protein
VAEQRGTRPDGDLAAGACLVADADSTFSSPSITQDGNGIIVAAEGPDNSLLLY